MCRRKKCWIKEEFYLHNTNMSPHLCQAGGRSVLCAQIFALMSTTCCWTNRSHYRLERSDGFVETNCSLSLFLFLFFVLSIVRIQPRNRLRKKKEGEHCEAEPISLEVAWKHVQHQAGGPWTQVAFHMFGLRRLRWRSGLSAVYVQ